MGVAGLVAALYLSISTLVAGYRTARGSGAARSGAADYRAWFAGTLALLVAMLVSLAASSTLFMLFIAFGVLLAPGLSPTTPAEKPPTGVTVVRIVSCVVAAGLLVFAALTVFIQITAATADSGDLDAALAQISRAAALAPWDSGIRDLRYQTTVQAALERAFGGAPDAAEAIDAAEQALARATAREPYEYLHHYRMALLLIAAGQKLGNQYTERGIEAGLRGLELYPSSVELRTGIASGYLQLNQPSKAEALVRDVWMLDPNYARAGITYVQALDALGKDAEAASVLSELKQRFPDDPAVDELQTGLTTD